MRQDVIARVTQQLRVVVSRRFSVPAGLWGEPGIGKSHAAQAILESIPCRNLSLHATLVGSRLAAVLPKARTLPTWVQTQLARLERGESLGTDAFAMTFAAALSELAPFVLHLEDVHELGQDGLELIAALALALTRTRGVGLLATSRAALPAPFRNHQLEAVTLTETAALLAQTLGADAPPASSEFIFGRARGNPLFTLEFLRYLMRHGYMWSDGERWNWRAPPEGFMPVTVDVLISQLVESLTQTPQARAVLEARAMLPSELSPELLAGVWAEVAGVEPQVLADTALALERGGLFNRQGFAHPLFAEMTRRDLPAAQRRVYATRAMRAFESSAPVLAAEYVDEAGLEAEAVVERLERAARQLQQASDLSRATQLFGLAAERAQGENRVRLALEAAEVAYRVSLNGESARFARLALETQPENQQARLQLVVALGMMGMDEAVKAIIAELPAADQTDVRWVDALFIAQAQSARSGNALQTWRENPVLQSLPRSLCFAAHTYANLGDFSAAEGLIAQALEFTELKPSLRSNQMGLLAFIRSEQGQLEAAQQLHDQGLELARQIADTGNLAASLYNAAFNLYRLGRYQDAIKYLEEAIHHYDQNGIYLYGANAQTILGMVQTQLGQFERAETSMLAAYDTLSRLEVTHGLANCEWSLGQLYATWRPPHGGVLALKFVGDALKHSREMGNARCLGGALPAAASVEAWVGNPERALALAQEASDLGLTSLEDVYACDTAMASALEANGQLAAALECWNVALRRTPFIPAQFESELELARLTSDRARGLALLEEFEARGLGALAGRARRYFPALEDSPTKTAQTGVRLEVLGEIALTQDARPVSTRARKRLELLVYLLEARIAGHAEASVLELVDAFYPDLVELEAKKALKQLVYLNRTSLGAEVVVSTPTGYALGAISSDAEEFLARGDPSLWRGPYLGEFEDTWHPGVRGALSLALGNTIQALLESNPSEAARLSAILLRMEPFDTERLRLAVHCFERAGNFDAALSTYQAGRARLLEVGEVLPESKDRFLAQSAIH